MGLLELIFLAVGLSLDAFAVSVCRGLAGGRIGFKQCARCGIWFGGFQALMPTLGYFLGALFADAIRTVDHWVAFGLLAIIGINMLLEAFRPGEAPQTEEMGTREMFLMALATSIDALAAGITLAMAGNVSIWWAALLIGSVTFWMSAAGVKLGSLFGDRFQRKAQIAGGVILILLGVRMLTQHLGG